MKNITSITALAAASVLLLSACADNAASADENSDALSPAEETQEPVEDEAGEGVFAFHATDHMGPADEFRIELPDGLIEMAAAHEHRNGTLDIVLEAVTVRAGEHPDSQCALEIDFEYADGMHEKIDAMHGHEALHELQERGYNVTPFSYAVPSVGENRFSEDHHSAIVPVSCASSPSEGDTATLAFTWLDEERLLEGVRQSRLAEVEIGVMASGDLHIHSAEVHEEYHYSGDEHGWLHESQQVDSQGNLIDS